MKKKFLSPLVLFLLCSASSWLLVRCDQEPVTPEASLKVNSGSLAGVPAIETLQTVANDTFYLVNRASGKMLDVSSWGTTDGSNVLQWGGTGGTNQQWIFTELSSGAYTIVGVHSGKALEVASADTTAGANVDISTYTGSTGQQWEVVSIDSGYYKILNVNSGYALDVASQSIADGANLDQWGYWGGENQEWALVTTHYGGQLSWTFTTSGVDEAIVARITAAMDGAVARYNANAPWPARTLTVEYNTGVATADGNINGNIRFGASSDYQVVVTAMHEIAHTYGVGISSGWSANIDANYYFSGANAVEVIKTFDGEDATISTGGSHFWPYGLNYASEWSESAGFRHVKIVRAMIADGM